MWDTTPLSFIVNTDFDSPIFKDFEKVYKLISKDQHIRELPRKKFCEENIWICKPINLNQVFKS